ncbi:hypothetical protein RJT34_09878 [Clitoria ternatea]|uniref:USP domain-containing protein n=1 Tax=Clitoria ternatea TaxID=43366 RepID=A0AAN9K7Z3_CLITE
MGVGLILASLKRKLEIRDTSSCRAEIERLEEEIHNRSDEQPKSEIVALIGLCALDKLERCFLDLKKSSINFEDDNLVEKVFGGRLISKLQCCSCGSTSDTYEPLIDLSLEIDTVDSLPFALQSFTKVETIDAMFRCDNCKEELSMEKQLMLDQPPSVAAFHLKRFKTDGIFVQKIDKHVDFPLELDLQPYTVPNQDIVTLKYDLYAVVVHIGFSSTSGHYYCFIRSAPNTWHKLDDSKVAFIFPRCAFIVK